MPISPLPTRSVRSDLPELDQVAVSPEPGPQRRPTRRKRRRAAPCYPGELGRRIPRQALARLAHHEDELVVEMQRRFALLFRHYEIDPSADQAWLWLVGEMAKAHVPGFQITGKSGRPRGTTKVGSEDMAEALAWLDAQIGTTAAASRLSRGAALRKVLHWARHDREFAAEFPAALRGTTGKPLSQARLHTLLDAHRCPAWSRLKA